MPARFPRAIVLFVSAGLACTVEGQSVGSLEDDPLPSSAATGGSEDSTESGSMGSTEGGSDEGETGAAALSEEDFWHRVFWAQCGEVYGCECSQPSPSFPDIGDCMVEQGRTVLDDRESAKALGMSFDAACAQRWLDYLEAWSCGPSSGAQFELMQAEAVCGCSIYRGVERKGDACHVFNSPNEVVSPWFNQCAPGLMCTDAGQCIPHGPICKEAGPGGECLITYERTDGVVEERELECPPATYCNGETRRCEDKGALYETCSPNSLGHSPCDEGLDCQANVCLPLAQVGSPCLHDSDCKTWQCDQSTLQCSEDASICH